ncbi:MAG: tetratricopeptide repeat protein [Syntrophus sp. (in: bacteria)]|nr:tetratricopeptide repeat protein [Syntrophus sp. (in: bacteria)]
MEIRTSTEINAADILFSAMTPTSGMVEYITGQALSRGIDAYSNGDYDRAVRDFRLAISLDPYSDNALSAFEYMGDALENSGKTAEAIKIYRQAIALFPTESGFNTSLGNLLFADGQHEEALKQYAAAVQKNTADSENYYSLGQAYLALERYNEAETQFKKVIQMSPTESAGYCALGQVYRMAGKDKDAETMLEKALAIGQDFANAHYELGMLYAGQRQIEAAQEELKYLATENSNFYEDLLYTINENSAPKMIAAYIANLNLASRAGTKVSSLDSSLQNAGTGKKYTMDFVFDKEMDVPSILNSANWNIFRSNSASTGGLYNWGLKVPSTEISLSPQPLSVTYDPNSLTAKVTFKITQNDNADGTIDLSHLVFKFKGTDVYGNAMDSSADEYNRFSRIV